ncbi:hypothetical protein NOI24_22470 [Neorhizobium galegae]|uniref:hypothetical protein n=1 Tax=Neorhizobium galegae TaxID=399 RepID=UPI002107B00D|nr:hypothetical protein [Neorhizobium galegae]MCQ1774086.1 hypothetical protein [Neorhizobium galegae]MCQ1800133.1 hypothetical protein [Neorhizobium galegae]
MAFTGGVDERMDCESAARDIAFLLSRSIMKPVTIDVLWEGQDDDIIVVKPGVRVA